MNPQESSLWHKQWDQLNQKISHARQNEALYQRAIAQSNKSPFEWTRAETLIETYELEQHKTIRYSSNLNNLAKTNNQYNKPKEVFDAAQISEALITNPEETYRAIFGEPKKTTTKEMRYSGGLIVSLKGVKSGFWYDFSEGAGGNPLQALMRERGLSFQEALKEGAAIAGISGLKFIFKPITVSKADKTNEMEEEKNKIISAKSILKGGLPIKGTLAERYLKQHRGIENPERLNILFWPKGAPWKATDDNGKLFDKINKVPALLIAAKNEKGEITGVQRVYLDSKTAKKNTFMDTAKLSKGRIEGSAGILQRGEKSGALYLAEGPETGASIAMANPKATVLVSFGLSNLKNLAKIINNFQPNEVIIAGDNDTLAKNNTQKATIKAQEILANEEIKSTIIIPKNIEGREKTDWNDVHKAQGIMQVRQQLGLLDNNHIQQVKNKLNHEITSELINNDNGFNRAQDRLQKETSLQQYELDRKNINAYKSQEKTNSIDSMTPISNPLERRQKTMDLEI